MPGDQQVDSERREPTFVAPCDTSTVTDVTAAMARLDAEFTDACQQGAPVAPCGVSDITDVTARMGHLNAEFAGYLHTTSESDGDSDSILSSAEHYARVDRDDKLLLLGGQRVWDLGLGGAGRGLVWGVTVVLGCGNNGSINLYVQF